MSFLNIQNICQSLYNHVWFISNTMQSITCSLLNFAIWAVFIHYLLSSNTRRIRILDRESTVALRMSHRNEMKFCRDKRCAAVSRLRTTEGESREWLGAALAMWPWKGDCNPGGFGGEIPALAGEVLVPLCNALTHLVRSNVCDSLPVF